MKFRLLFVLIILLGLIKGYTQDKPFRFGFVAAPNIAWISPDAEGYENDGWAMGFSWGLNADFTLTKNYFIRTGFTMDHLNANLKFPYAKDTSDMGTLSRKYILRYLEIPLTLKLRTNQFGKIAYFGEMGFGTAFNIRAKSKDDYTNTNGTTTSSESEIKNDIALIKESLIIGAGVEYFIDESTSLIFGIGFHNGLTDILNGENTKNSSIQENGLLNYFQINFGIIF